MAKSTTRKHVFHPVHELSLPGLRKQLALAQRLGNKQVEQETAAEIRKRTIHPADVALPPAFVDDVFAAVQHYRHAHGGGSAGGRTWPMLYRKGCVATVSELIMRKDGTLGFKTLLAAGFAEYSYEAVALRWPHLFTPEVLAAARARLTAAGKKPVGI